MKKNKTHPLLTELSKLLKRAKDREGLTVEQIQELRADLSSTKGIIVDTLFPIVSSKRISTELLMENLEGKEFVRYLKGFMSATILDENDEPILDAKGNPKKYTASIAESLARKALHAEGTPYYKAKKNYLEAKNEEYRFYQLFKAVDQVTNSLSTISKT